MYQIDETVYMLDDILNSKRKRHLVGGALISVGLLCFGLAITAISLQEEES